MNYIWKYKTPDGLDDILMTGDGEYLTGLWFEGTGSEKKHQLQGKRAETDIFLRTAAWLDGYFAGNPPAELPPYKILNSTPFRAEVLNLLLEIPYGETMTYGELARKIAEKRGVPKMSAQAVGQAVGWNPIGILIPCHRIIGSDGTLTGYGGGLENKKWLLEHEQKSRKEA